MHIVHYQRKPRASGNYSIEGLFAAVREELAGRATIETRIAPEFSNGLLPRWRIAKDAARSQGDIIHVTGDIHFAACLLSPHNSMLTVHDCGFMNHARGIKRLILKTFWLDYPVRRVRCVTTVSEATRQDLIRYTACNPAKVHVVPNAISKAFPYSPKPESDSDFRFLVVGTAPNKNLHRIISALEGIPAHLRIIGEIDDSIKKGCQSRRVSMSNTSHLDRNAMIGEYIEAHALLFPSTLEGFGIPIIEAQSIGRPVITSNISSMPEVAGDGACLVDPLDIASIRAGILKVMQDVSYRADLVERGRMNAQRFTPSAMAQGYFDLYQRMLGISAQDNGVGRC